MHYLIVTKRCRVAKLWYRVWLQERMISVACRHYWTYDQDSYYRKPPKPLVYSCLCLSTHTHTHTHTGARAHARTHTVCTYTHTYIYIKLKTSSQLFILQNLIKLSFSKCFDFLQQLWGYFGFFRSLYEFNLLQTSSILRKGFSTAGDFIQWAVQAERLIIFVLMKCKPKHLC